MNSILAVGGQKRAFFLVFWKILKEKSFRKTNKNIRKALTEPAFFRIIEL